MTRPSPTARFTSSRMSSARVTNIAAIPTATITFAAIRRKTRLFPSNCLRAESSFFAYGTPHCTRANTTDRERAGVALHFLTQQAAQGAKGGYAQDKRPLLTGRDATGGKREYGVTIAGTWEQEVENALCAASQPA